MYITVMGNMVKVLDSKLQMYLPILESRLTPKLPHLLLTCMVNWGYVLYNLEPLIGLYTCMVLFILYMVMGWVSARLQKLVSSPATPTTWRSIW